MAPAPMFSTENAFTEFLAANIWIPILAISAAVLIVIFIVICVWKCRGSTGYDYSILKADFALPQKLEMERKLQYDTMRETALLHCQFYLRSSGIYTPVEHLSEIGSRVGKHWFMVRDTRSKVDKLLTMVPRRHQYLLPFTSATRATLLSILQAIQHPYIYPIYDLDLLSEQGRIVLILPYNSKGSLKDIIYHAHCMDTWSSKYYMAGTGLPSHLVARYGRQILKGLIFLQKSGFPPNGHLHSGNVILQNDTCRLSGYENDLIGLSPKMYGMMTKLLRDDQAAIEVVSFGHLVYEMTMGNEMEVTIPQSRHLETIPDSNIKQCLEFIFTSSAESYHSLKEICEHPFFKSVSLLELEVFRRAPVKFSKSQKAVLKAVRRGKAPNMRKPSGPATSTTSLSSQIPEKKRSAYRSPPDLKEPTGRFQLPPPMSLRVKGSLRKIPVQQQSTSPEQQKPTLPTLREQVSSPPKPALPLFKPALPMRLRDAPAPPRPGSQPQPRSPQIKPTVSPSDKAALLNQIRLGADLKPVHPRL